MLLRRISIFALSVFLCAMLAPASQADTHWKETCEASLEDPTLKWLMCMSAPSMLDECRAEWGKAPASSTCGSARSDYQFQRGKCRLSKICPYYSRAHKKTLNRLNTFYLLPSEVSRLCVYHEGNMRLGPC